MMGLVLAVHVVAIAIYRLADIQHRAPATTRTFGAIWTGLTLVVVIVGLQRVRRARDAARAARAARRG